MTITLERVAALAQSHGLDALMISMHGPAATRSFGQREHEEIAEICKWYLSAVQARSTLREQYAGLAMQGLLAGMSADPFNLLSGPQIAGTAVDIADCLLAALKIPPP